MLARLLARLPLLGSVYVPTPDPRARPDLERERRRLARIDSQRQYGAHLLGCPECLAAVHRGTAPAGMCVTGAALRAAAIAADLLARGRAWLT